MLRYLSDPLDAGRLELRRRAEPGGAGRVGRQAARDGARDERGALLLQLFDEPALLFNELIEFCCRVVEECADRGSLSRRRECGA